MPRDDYVLLESFVVPEAAAMLRSRLELAGIPSLIENETVAGTLWHIGSTVGGTRLLVPADRLDEARQLLAEDHEHTTEAWTCACGTLVEAGFDLCWHCGAARPADAAETITAVAESTKEQAAVDAPVIAGDEAEAAVLRAWRAAIIGLGLCPGILHIYSLALLLQNMNVTLSPAGSRRFLGALLIDAAVLLVVVKLVLTYGI
jgi:hypothetical protein